MDFLGGERDLHSFNRAHSHSGRVRILRIALPLLGIFIISVVAGAYYWSQKSLPELVIESTVIENNKMVMKNPELNGLDKESRPYSLSAREAITDPSEPKKVELIDIAAQVPLEEGLFANIIAGTGFYDSEAKTLLLGGNVDVNTDDGMTMSLKDADVDMGSGSLVSKNPVIIKTEQAVISADSLTVNNNGEKVVFENRVKMTIYPDKIQQDKPSVEAQN
jgi:lipopolysaccharide export system protein LptC